MAAARKRSELGPSQVETWKRTGIVAPALRPILEARIEMYRDMIQDCGGIDEVSTMKRALLDGWIQAQTAADIEFQRLLRDPTKEIPERLTTCLNTARAALTSLGLERRAREVMDPHEFARQWDAEHAAEGESK